MTPHRHSIEPDKLYTTTGAAAAIGISRQSWLTKAKRHHVQPLVLFGRKHYRGADILAAVERGATMDKAKQSPGQRPARQTQSTTTKQEQDSCNTTNIE